MVLLINYLLLLEFLHNLKLFHDSKYRNLRNKTEPLVLLKKHNK